MSTLTVTFFQEEVTGALLISGLISYAAFGVVLFQSISYFSRFQKDRVAFKILVGFCLGICAIDTALSGSWCYKWLVSHYGDPSSTLIVPFEFAVSTFLMGTVTLVVQSFYSWRLWKIASGKLERIIIPAIIMSFSFTQWAATLYVFPVIIRHPSYDYLAVHLFPAAWIWLVGSCLGDLVITTSMFYFLHIKARGVKVSENIFIRIVKRSLQANALSLATELLIAISFKLKAASLWWVLGLFIAGKVYTFSMVASLNARDSSDQHYLQNTSLGSASNQGAPSSERQEALRDNPGRLRIANEVFVKSEIKIELEEHAESWPVKRSVTYLV